LSSKKIEQVGGKKGGNEAEHPWARAVDGTEKGKNGRRRREGPPMGIGKKTPNSHKSAPTPTRSASQHPVLNSERPAGKGKAKGSGETRG